MSNHLPIQQILTDEHLHALGLVIAEWGKAEQAIFLTLTQLGGAKREPQTNAKEMFAILVTAGMDARPAMGILMGIVGADDPASLPEFKRLEARFKKLYDRRNVIAHAAWTAGKRPKSIETSHLKAVGKIALEHHAFTPTELRAIASRIHDWRGDLMVFFHARGYWKPSPSHGKPRGAGAP